MKTVAVLFARSDSIYKLDRRCDVFDLDRHARPRVTPCAAIPSELDDRLGRTNV